MRTKKAIRNVFAGWLGQSMMIFLNLFMRRYFLNILGDEYLGLNSLFTNVVTLLSMAEMGIGTAITYSLYQPLAEGDQEKVSSLMQLYKTAYWCIGAAVAAGGILLTPLLPLFTRGEVFVYDINIIYYFFLANVAVSYFFSYKSALLTADQEGYLFSVNHYCWQFLMYLAQIFILVAAQNYYLYLAAQVLSTLGENITISRVADKKYPYLKEQKIRTPLDKKTKKDIKQNTASMVLNKAGSSIVNSTDNLFISSFAGLRMTGIYNNYAAIVSAAGVFLQQGINAAVSSIGNLSIEGTNERRKQIFDVAYLVCSWLYGWTAIMLFYLLTPFIHLWYGGQYSLGTGILLWICMNKFLEGQTVLMGVHISAMGLYWHVKYKGIVEAAINVAASAVLGMKYGIAGILAGTFVSHVVWSIWIDAHTVFHYGFRKKSGQYYFWLFRDFFIFIAVAAVTGFLLSFITGMSFLAFCCKAVICTVVPNVLFWLAYHHMGAFLELRRMSAYMIRNFARNFRIKDRDGKSERNGS